MFGFIPGGLWLDSSVSLFFFEVWLEKFPISQILMIKSKHAVATKLELLFPGWN
jgi:hypothetical protein